MAETDWVTIGFTAWLGPGWKPCDAAVCHLKPRERTHFQHTCDPGFNRRSLIILARSSRAPGPGPEQSASLFESLDNNHLFPSTVSGRCRCFPKTLSEPICSSRPLFPPTFWKYPPIHSYSSLSTCIWRSVERLLHSLVLLPRLTIAYEQSLRARTLETQRYTLTWAQFCRGNSSLGRPVLGPVGGWRG